VCSEAYCLVGDAIKGLGGLFTIFASSDYKVRFLKGKASASCVACGKAAARFSTPSAKFEYRISALCQQCQSRFLDGTRSLRPVVLKEMA
jgi:hypothetical protein